MQVASEMNEGWPMGLMFYNSLSLVISSFKPEYVFLVHVSLYIMKE